jgi:hypothetical protein
VLACHRIKERNGRKGKDFMPYLEGPVRLHSRSGYRLHTEIRTGGDTQGYPEGWMDDVDDYEMNTQSRQMMLLRDKHFK